MPSHQPTTRQPSPNPSQEPTLEPSLHATPNPTAQPVHPNSTQTYPTASPTAQPVHTNATQTYPTASPTKMPPGLPVASPTSAPRNHCPSGYTLLDDTCYGTEAEDLSATWSECQALCSDAGAEMLCIDDSDQWDAFTSAFGSPNIWLGRNNMADGGTFVWDGDCTSTYDHDFYVNDYRK